MKGESYHKWKTTVSSSLCCSFHFLMLCTFQSSFAITTITRNQAIKDGGETLLSTPSGKFELGFFSPGTSKNRYLGMWLKKIPRTVLWVANREAPVTDGNGVLEIGQDGNLVLLDQAKKVVWSTNVSGTVGDAVVQLFDTGNLVLMEGNGGGLSTGSYLWQSFDHPSDSMIPGTKVGRNLRSGQEMYLTAWSSPDDPSPSDFTLRLSPHGLPQMLTLRGSVTKMRLGPWNGVRMGYVPTTNAVRQGLVVHTAEELYFTYESLPSPAMLRVTLNQSGWEASAVEAHDTEWRTLIWMPYDVCDNYRHCGANTICRPGATPCECLKGFINNDQEVNWKNWFDSKSCKRKLESVVNCQTEEGFLKLEGLKLPDLIEFQVNESMTLEECYTECFRNCSCRAYANYNATRGGTGCLMWFGDLVDIRESGALGYGQDLYLRVPVSELESVPHSSNKKRLKNILAVTLPTMLGVAIILCLLFYTRSKKRRGKENEADDEEMHLFNLDTIATATNNFSNANKIGEGGFGSVYKGTLLTGKEIAVKKLSKNSKQGAEEFRNEAFLISKLQHKNLVGLIGTCTEGEDRMLIYEYMPNKSLDYFIFDVERSALLAWKTRHSIIFGIARGLLYLHQDSKLQVIHRDLKPGNILLDSNLNPKISDFGLARIFGDDDEDQAETNRVIGTYGYMPPEYAIKGIFSIKSDVFSFGVLLLEIISGKKNRVFSHPDHHHNLMGHAWLLWSQDRAMELMDSTLEDSCIKSQVIRCIHVGLLCVQNLPDDRPTMSSIVAMLTNEEATLPQPEQPGFFVEASSKSQATSGTETTYSRNTMSTSVLQAR